MSKHCSNKLNACISLESISVFPLFRTEFPDHQRRCRKHAGHPGNIHARYSRPQRRTSTDEFEDRHGLTAACGIRYEDPSETECCTQLEASAAARFDGQNCESEAEFGCKQAFATIEFAQDSASDKRSALWWHASRKISEEDGGQGSQG